jgi:hypothetical protein
MAVRDAIMIGEGVEELKKKGGGENVSLQYSTAIYLYLYLYLCR